MRRTYNGNRIAVGAIPVRIHAHGCTVMTIQSALFDYPIKKLNVERCIAQCKTHHCSTVSLAQVRFEYEFHDEEGKWFRAHGNEVSLQLQQAVQRTVYVWLETGESGVVGLGYRVLGDNCQTFKNKSRCIVAEVRGQLPPSKIWCSEGTCHSSGWGLVRPAASLEMHLCSAATVL